MATPHRIDTHTHILPSQLRGSSLLAAAEPAHILFGTDFPHAPIQVGAAFTSMYESYSMSDAQRASIDCGAAERLFPRLTL